MQVFLESSLDGFESFSGTHRNNYNGGRDDTYFGKNLLLWGYIAMARAS